MPSSPIRILLMIAFALAGTLNLCPCPSTAMAETAGPDTCCPLSASTPDPERPSPDRPDDCTHCQSLTFTAPNAGSDVATAWASPPPSFPLPVAASVTLTWTADPTAPRTRGGPDPPGLVDRTSLHAQRILFLI